jgi:thiol:disulfide interchange protein
MKRLLALALTMVVVLPALADDTKKDATKKSPVFHKVNFKKALDMAKKDKKVVMIDFYTDW